MSKDKHTPGPWKSVPDHDMGADFYVETDPNIERSTPGRRICIIVKGSPRQNSKGESLSLIHTEEDMANNRLIAASPALLSASEWLLNVICGVGRAGGEPEPGEFEAACEAAKSAIKSAKPKGKE